MILNNLSIETYYFNSFFSLEKQTWNMFMKLELYKYLFFKYTTYLKYTIYFINNQKIIELIYRPLSSNNFFSFSNIYSNNPVTI